MKKKDESAGSPDLQDPPARILVALSDDCANTLRRIATTTKLTQTDLRDAIEKDPGVARAIHDCLREHYKLWQRNNNPFKEEVKDGAS